MTNLDKLDMKFKTAGSCVIACSQCFHQRGMGVIISPLKCPETGKICYFDQDFQQNHSLSLPPLKKFLEEPLNCNKTFFCRQGEKHLRRGLKLNSGFLKGVPCLLFKRAWLEHCHSANKRKIPWDEKSIETAHLMEKSACQMRIMRF